jgi:hypothetical protein
LAVAVAVYRRCPLFLLTNKFNKAGLIFRCAAPVPGLIGFFSTNIRAPNGAFGQRIFCPRLIRRCFFRLEPEMPRYSAPAIFVEQLPTANCYCYCYRLLILPLFHLLCLLLFFLSHFLSLFGLFLLYFSLLGGFFGLFCRSFGLFSGSFSLFSGLFSLRGSLFGVLLRCFSVFLGFFYRFFFFFFHFLLFFRSRLSLSAQRLDREEQSEKG